MKGIFLILLSIFIAISSCNSGSQSASPAQQDYTTNLKFDENQAYQYIEAQVAFGPRNPGSQGHEKCAEYLLNQLKQLTDTAYFQEFDAHTFDNKTFKSKNILAKINPKSPNRILLCAHWDTRPFADQDASNQNSPILGANDGGSGVGVILAIAKAIKSSPLELGIDIVFFDIEDYGRPEHSEFTPMEDDWCLGSQYYAKNYNEPTKPRWGILLDMVGGSNATFQKEEISMLYAPSLTNRVWQRGQDLGYQANFVNTELSAITDDHLYLNTIAQIPTIDIIHYQLDHKGFAEYWHTHNDDLKHVDKITLKAVGRTLESTIREENQIAI